MGGYGKKILIFFILLNMLMLIFGMNPDTSILTTDPSTDPNASTGFGFDIDADARTVSPPSVEILLNTILPLAAVSAIIGAIAIGLAGNLDVGFRITFSGFLTTLVIYPMNMLLSSTDMPFELKLLVGAIFTIFYILAIMDYIGGVEF